MPKHDPIRNPTKQQLKTLRRTFGILKSKGLIESKSSPSKVKLTTQLRKKLVLLQPLAQGKAIILDIVRTPVSSKAQAKKAYKESGHVVIGDKLIIPKKPRTIAFIDKRGFATTRARVGSGFITRVILPIPYVDLAQWIDDAKKMKALEKLKASNESWGFSFFGGNSHNTFPTLRDMLEKFRYYLSVDKAIEDGDSEGQRELFKNLELVRIVRPKELWSFNTGMGGGDVRRPQDREQQKKDALEGSKWQKYRARMKRRRPARAKAMQQADAKRKRIWRAKLKKNRTSYRKFLATDRKRWKARVKARELRASKFEKKQEKFMKRHKRFVAKEGKRRK